MVARVERPSALCAKRLGVRRAAPLWIPSQIIPIDDSSKAAIHGALQSASHTERGVGSIAPRVGPALHRLTVLASRFNRALSASTHSTC